MNQYDGMSSVPKHLIPCDYLRHVGVLHEGGTEGGGGHGELVRQPTEGLLAPTVAVEVVVRLERHGPPRHVRRRNLLAIDRIVDWRPFTAQLTHTLTGYLERK
jgi:hypothetical protein